MGVLDRRTLTAPPDNDWGRALLAINEKELQEQVSNPWWNWKAPNPFGSSLNTRLDGYAKDAFQAAKRFIDKRRPPLPTSTANTFMLVCANAAAEMAIRGEIEWNVAISIRDILPMLMDHGHTVSSAVTGVVTYNNLLHTYSYDNPLTIRYGTLVAAQVTLILDARGNKMALESGIQAGFAAAEAMHRGGLPLIASVSAAKAAADVTLLGTIPTQYRTRAIRLAGSQAGIYYDMFRRTATMSPEACERAAIAAGVQAAEAYGRYGDVQVAYAAADQAAIHATRGEPEAVYEAAGSAGAYAGYLKLNPSDTKNMADLAIKMAARNAESPYREYIVLAAIELGQKQLTRRFSSAAMEDAENCVDSLLDPESALPPKTEVAVGSALAVAAAYSSYHEPGDEKDWKVACKAAMRSWYEYPGDQTSVDLGAKIAVSVFRLIRLIKDPDFPLSAAGDIPLEARAFTGKLYRNQAYTADYCLVAAKTIGVTAMDGRSREAAAYAARMAADLRHAGEAFDQKQAVETGRVVGELYGLWGKIPASVRATKDRDTVLIACARVALQLSKWNYERQAIQAGARITLAALANDISEETAEKAGRNAALQVIAHANMEKVVWYIGVATEKKDKPPGGWSQFIRRLGIPGEDEYNDDDSDDE